VIEGRLTRIGLRLWVVAVLAFLFVPIAIIVLYAFNATNIQTWPIKGLSTRWLAVAWHDPQVRSALVLSLKAGLLATGVALVLGSAAAFGVHRFRFFGREAVSLILVLPLALPGIITGIALNSAFQYVGINLSLLTIVIGHATFCIVVVYNNVIARLRRVSGSLYEAAADLGASGLFTFRTITLPTLSTALVSGALLAFALSFDEVIVTTFTAGAQTTLPLWIFGAIRLGQQLPEVNVVVVAVLALTLIPVAISARLTGGGGVTGGSAAPPRRERIARGAPALAGDGAAVEPPGL
jgi:putative spermidine/putrescine transport system permease protein